MSYRDAPCVLFLKEGEVGTRCGGRVGKVCTWANIGLANAGRNKVSVSTG